MELPLGKAINHNSCNWDKIWTWCGKRDNIVTFHYGEIRTHVAQLAAQMFVILFWNVVSSTLLSANIAPFEYRWLLERCFNSYDDSERRVLLA